MARKAKSVGEKADEMIARLAKEKGIEPDEQVDENVLQDEPAPDLDELSEDDLSKLDEDEDETPPPNNYEQQYNVLQGKYNAETSRLGEALTNALGQIQSLRLEVENLKKGKGNAEVNEGGDEDEDIEKLFNEYPSLVKGLVAVAKREAKNTTKDTEARVENLAQKNAANDRNKYYESLTERIPRWQELNAHPTFLKWLAVRDKYTGQPRSNLLRSAFDQLDVTTSAVFFEDFMQEKGIRNQGSRAETDTDEIAPNTSGLNSQQRKTKPGTITRAEIDKFYQERARGKFAGTEEQAAAFEKRMMQAVKEGKVV
jgi:hypothetical protein